MLKSIQELSGIDGSLDTVQSSTTRLSDFVDSVRSKTSSQPEKFTELRKMNVGLSPLLHIL